ncbi:MAG: hydroxyethylthiazole kinase [Candidatus Diapherotrites archaeon]
MDYLREKIREQKPLVHHITNWVTIYDCANVCRAIGSLPVMAHAKEEVQEMTGIASALVLNIGTLTNELIEAMKLAGKKANEKGIPVVLDAVGAGATKMRTEKVKELLNEIKIDLIKGNSAEIGIIAGVEAEVKGVEAINVSKEPKELVKDLAKELNAVVIATGKIDYVSDGKRVFAVKNGHSLMGQVVGTGCMAASVIGSFAAVEKDYASAAAQALSFYGVAAELAAKESKGPGTFKEKFFDELFNLNEKTFNEMKKINEL